MPETRRISFNFPAKPPPRNNYGWRGGWMLAASGKHSRISRESEPRVANRGKVRLG